MTKARTDLKSTSRSCRKGFESTQTSKLLEAKFKKRETVLEVIVWS